MIKFDNPFTILMKCAKEIYPAINCKIHFVAKLKRCKGVTIFPEDGSEPIIQIDSRLRLSKAVEILAHELSHVICGVKENHGENWERVREMFHTKYHNKVRKIEQTED